ncbi:MAG: hypothetical protein JWM98_254 [Thermoleophilia bacterium]|nr:hypothetical protein [Thermoleophilia bacterium]
MTDVRAQQAVYGARVEQKFGIREDAADGILAEIQAHLPRDPMYPTAQPVSTTYIRSIDDAGPKGKIRVRSYPASESAPTFLEFKESAKAADELGTKTRIPVAKDFVSQLLGGADTKDAVDLVHRSGDELPTAERAVRLIGEGMEPAVRVDYLREAFEDTAGTVRVTVDRNLVQTGIGRLAGTSTPRPGVIMELKTAGELPAWLDGILVAHADEITPLLKGKGSAALTAAKAGVELLR